MDSSKKPRAPTLGEFPAVMTEGRDAIPDLEILRRVIANAFILYDVATARARLGDLLAVEKHAGLHAHRVRPGPVHSAAAAKGSCGNPGRTGREQVDAR
jgi:hypothetical protein